MALPGKLAAQCSIERIKLGTDFSPPKKPRSAVLYRAFCYRNAVLPALFFAALSVADLVLSPRQTDKAAARRNQVSKEWFTRRELGRARIATPPCGSKPPLAQPVGLGLPGLTPGSGPGNTPVLRSGHRFAVNIDPERIMTFYCVSVTGGKKKITSSYGLGGIMRSRIPLLWISLYNLILSFLFPHQCVFRWYL